MLFLHSIFFIITFFVRLLGHFFFGQQAGEFFFQGSGGGFFFSGRFFLPLFGFFLKKTIGTL